MTARPIPEWTTETNPDAGVVYYRVTGFGTLTLGWDSSTAPGRRDVAIHVRYGYCADPDRWHSWEPWPEPVTVFGVRVGGAAVFDPERAVQHDAARAAGDRRHHAWLACRRQAESYAYGAGSAPDRTSDRVADVVAAAVVDFLTRDDLPALHAAHKARLAPSRYREACRAVDRCREKVAAAVDELNAVLAEADEQLALIPPDAVTA